MASEQRADVVLWGGRVWTGVDRSGPVEAVAVSGGRIVALGRVGEMRPLIGPRTRVVDLTGRLLMPAFQDAHCHPLLGGLATLRCLLGDASTVDEYLAIVGGYAEEHFRPPWVLGEGWSLAALLDVPSPRDLLDRVVPDRPVFLESSDGHMGWVNSAALRMAGIDERTPDPPAGRIERDADDRPSGILMEHAVDLVADLAPPSTADELDEGLRIGQAYLHGLGISAWGEAHVDPDREAAYLRLVASGELTGKVAASLLWDERRGLDQVPELVERRAALDAGGLGRVRGVAVKLFQDGVIEGRTAALLEPYLGRDGGRSADRGEPRYPPDELREIVTALDAEGFAVHAHAMGDRAIRDVLDALTTARVTNGPRDARHHIAHLQLIDPADIPRFGALGVVANVQPYWAYEDVAISQLTRPVVGDERTDRMYPFASLLRAGATLAMGSDWSVTTADPLAILEVAERRTDPRDRDAPAFVPAERIQLEQGLRAFTRGSAFVNRLDGETGTIELGKAADLVVLDRDILPVDAGPPGDARVLMTLVDGRPVFEAAEVEAVGA